MSDVNEGIPIDKKSDPEVMTVGVEIHKQHGDAFFLRSQRYLYR
jgi:hypothetical protein